MYTENKNQKVIIGILVGLLVIIAAFLIARYFVNKSSISTFDECAAAGYPITKSYPEQCQTPDGKVFTNGAASQNLAPGFIAGKVTLKAICPIDEACSLPADAYTSREIVLYAADETTIKNRVRLDANGNYRISVEPGSYWLQLNDSQGGQSDKKPVSVMSTATTSVNFAIDVPLFAKG